MTKLMEYSLVISYKVSTLVLVFSVDICGLFYGKWPSGMAQINVPFGLWMERSLCFSSL